MLSHVEYMSHVCVAGRIGVVNGNYNDVDSARCQQGEGAIETECKWKWSQLSSPIPSHKGSALKQTNGDTVTMVTTISIIKDIIRVEWETRHTYVIYTTVSVALCWWWRSPQTCMFNVLEHGLPAEWNQTGQMERLINWFYNNCR